VIVPREGVVADDALAARLQGFVRERLAAHLYPRRVHFAHALPMTATGKVMRGALRRDLAASLASTSEDRP
jgi:acetyl-CoA synthetase